MPPAIIGLGLSFLHLHHAEGPYPLIIAPQDPLRDPPMMCIVLALGCLWLLCQLPSGSAVGIIYVATLLLLEAF